MITGEKDEHADTEKAKEVFDSLQNAKQKKYISIQNGDHFMINWEHSYKEVQDHSLEFIERVMQQGGIRI